MYDKKTTYYGAGPSDNWSFFLSFHIDFQISQVT